MQTIFEPHSITVMIPCACGCGGETKINKQTGIPNKYIKGHSQRGIPHTDKTKQKMRNAKLGKPSPIKDIPKSEEHKRKMSSNQKGKPSPMKGKHHNDESIKKLREYIGEKASGWKGGISFLPYCEKFNDILKEKIRERDGRVCQLCGKSEDENKNKLSVHHIHYDKENCYPDLITLCISCNIKINSNRDYWEEFFMKILFYRDLLIN